MTGADKDMKKKIYSIAGLYSSVGYASSDKSTSINLKSRHQAKFLIGQSLYDIMLLPMPFLRHSNLQYIDWRVPNLFGVHSKQSADQVQF